MTDADAPTKWPAERRLRLLANLIARKRAESMGRVPKGDECNHETLLFIAVAPDDALEREYAETVAYMARAKIADLAPDEHFAALCKDIRHFFRGSDVPPWARQ